MFLRKFLCAVFLISFCISASAEVFTVKKIYVNGLKRITYGTVLSYLPIKVGDKIDSSETTDIIRDLYKTRFFSDVSVRRSGNNLIINVIERSVVGFLKITGNKKIPKKDLLEALRGVGIAEGYELDPSTLKAIKVAMIQQYYNFGLYGAKVDIDVKPMGRNRVSVVIKVTEGPKAKIRSIRIVGNKAFKESALVGEFTLSVAGSCRRPWAFMSGADQYSREKLDADLEKLRSFYMDRGYLNIKIDSTKVSITPDKRGIYIVIKITEGSIYHLSGFKLKGNLIDKRKEFLDLVKLKAGDVFSRKDVIKAQGDIALLLSENGYGMPDIIVDPKVDEKNKTVWMDFHINPGHRVYVRNITFTGNHKTNDDVLRREMRLQEGSKFSLSKINESRRRLANLGYLKDIQYKTVPVAGTNNQVDLEFEAKETSAIMASVQAGYSDRDGFLYGASLTDQNVLGTGKTVSIRFDNTKATQYYSFGYRNPYFTTDGVGMSFSGYLQKSNPNKISGDLSSYKKTIYGVMTSFDAPLSDYIYTSLGVGFEHIEINKAFNPNPKTEKFLSDYGRAFNQFKLVGSISYRNLDRALFPTKGFAHSFIVQGYGPLDRKSLEFYKLNYDATFYQPIVSDFILRLHTELGYGDGFGKSKDLPVFSNFFAGGMGSVRGFEASSIAADEKDADRVIGGNILTLGSASIILPSPMPDTIRPSIFFDIGSVYDNHFKFGDLRSSAGIQIEWRTPIAPLTFSLAKPIHKKAWDETTLFQFNISASI